ncbi:hypothetical protein B0T20DRAFT_471875 [Sordaria brevicollis]|uniref:Uncharacterized protein n=1 Tax=Sordaria brevicollis TaxID=83679 RepID=A0AAE0P9B9_SORBR|nr:hypothetical protein B0T20DRAFT_471875 [Sordaria brevicollis]
MSVVSTREAPAPVREGGSDDAPDAHREPSDSDTPSSAVSTPEPQPRQPGQNGYLSPPLAGSVDDLARFDRVEVVELGRLLQQSGNNRGPRRNRGPTAEYDWVADDEEDEGEEDEDSDDEQEDDDDDEDDDEDDGEDDGDDDDDDWEII